MESSLTSVRNMDNLNSLLFAQLEQLGLSPDSPPDPLTWRRLLTKVSERYDEFQRHSANNMSSHRNMNELFRVVFERSPIGICIVSPAGQYLRINEAYHTLLGYTESEILGRHYTDAIHPDDTDRFQIIGQYLLSGATEVYESERRYIRKDGKSLDALVDTVLIYDAHERPSHFIEMMVDISERKKVESDLLDSLQSYFDLYTEAQRQANELRLLGQIRGSLTGELDQELLLRRIVETIADNYVQKLISIYLREGDVLKLQYQIGYDQVIERIPIHKGVIGRVVRSGQAELIQDASQDRDFLSAVGGLVSEICVPLYTSGQVIGILNIESCEGDTPLNQTDLNLMIAVAEQVNLALERSKMYNAMRESETRYRLVVDNVREVIFQTDISGMFTFLNPAWTNMTGYTLEESLNNHHFNYIPEENQESNFIAVTELLQGEKGYSRYQTQYRHKDGSIVPVEVHVQLMTDREGIPTGMAGSITDISERIQAEKQALELELKIRTVETLKGFLTGVSHDLKTPLSVMSTSLYLLKRKLEAGSKEMHHVDTLTEQVEYLTRAFQDMLDMSKLDDELVEFDFLRVNLNSLIGDVLMNMEGDIQAKQHRLVFLADPQPHTIVVDQVMVGRAIKNLLSNAINYTTDNGTITVRTQFTDSLAVTEIEDTGIGIEPEDLPHIFDRFFKADKARTTGKNGTGLGLPIVKKIVEAHHGEIEVFSTPGQGSIFRVTLPLAADKAASGRAVTPHHVLHGVAS